MARRLTLDTVRRLPWAAGVVALVLFVLGALAFDHGLDRRGYREPPQLVVLPRDQLFRELPAEVASGAEIRARSLTSPSPVLRHVGATWRHVGVGLLLAALAAAFVGGRSAQRHRPVAAWLVRTLWCAPGVYGIWVLLGQAGARAPSAELAREAFVGALPLIALGLVLLLAWRR